MRRMLLIACSVGCALFVTLWAVSLIWLFRMELPLPGDGRVLTVEQCAGRFSILFHRMTPTIAVPTVVVEDRSQGAELYRLVPAFELDSFSYDLPARAALPSRHWSGYSIRFPHWCPATLFAVGWVFAFVRGRPAAQQLNGRDKVQVSRDKVQVSDDIPISGFRPEGAE